MDFLLQLSLLLIPSLLVVGFWRSRPIIAFLCATILLLLLAFVPKIISVFRAVAIYGNGDPQLMAGEISNAIVTGLLSLIFGVPILLVFQWVMRRNYKATPTKIEINQTFD